MVDAGQEGDRVAPPPRAVAIRTLYVEVTNRCNSKCTSCVRTFDLAEPETDLSLSAIESLVRGLEARDRPERVVLNGVGEATLHADLVAIVKLFVSTGAHVLFNSNAVRLPPSLAVALGRAGLAELRISIDGASRATYRRLRGIDALDRVIDNVKGAERALGEAGLDAPKLSLWFTAARSNVKEWPDMVRLTHAAGLTHLYFQRLVYREGDDAIGSASADEALTHGLSDEEKTALGRARELAAELGVSIGGSGASDDAGAVIDLPETNRPWGPCWRPYQSTYVTANGNVLPCCVAPFAVKNYEGITLGRVSEETSLSEVFHGERYRAFREAFETEDPFECCARCGRDWSL